MAVLRRSAPGLAVVLPLLAGLGGCNPIDIAVFGEETADDSPPSPRIIGLGGAGPTGGFGGLGGAGAVQVFAVDEFDDGDTKAEEPAGWWYPANDGTGVQTLSIVSAAQASAGGSTEDNVLEVDARGFSDWGSAFGVDIAEYNFPEEALELNFRIVAAQPVEVSLHVIDRTGTHFARTIFVPTSWTEFHLRLDQLFVVESDTVRRFAPAEADELQWFVFGGQDNTIWMDGVFFRGY